MALYLVSRRDQWDAFVIRAKNEDEARMIAIEHSKGAGEYGFIDAEIKYLQRSGPSEVVLESFRAG